MEHDPIVADIETAPIENARDYIDPPDLSDIQAPKNYVKADAIADYIAREKAKRLEDYEADCSSKAALDFNCARIVAIAWWTEQDGMSHIACRSEVEEAYALREFWDDAKHRQVIGFRIREFDIPMMVQRSRYLNVPHFVPDLGRYARWNGITDLYDLLTFQDMRQESVMRRSAKAFAKRFGIPVTDPIDGKDIPALVAAGKWDEVVAHAVADVELTVALARRLGIIRATVEEPVF